VSKWTEARVTDALRRHYLPEGSQLIQEEWAFLTQVLLRAPNPLYAHLFTGDQPRSKWVANERKIDVLLVRNWSGGKQGHERIAIEIKVTRADYRNDTDLKRGPAEASAHRCFYAAPVGLIDPATLPEGWGLIEITDDDTVTWTVKATRRDPTIVSVPGGTDYLISAGFRRASRAEEKIRRGETDATEVATLRAENERLKGIAQRAVEARDREMERAKTARSELMSRFGNKPVCAACGGKVTWTRGRYDSKWEHADKQAGYACHDRLYAAYNEARQAGQNPPYPSGQPDPIEAGQWEAPHA
jgi:hypothetical protein